MALIASDRQPAAIEQLGRDHTRISAAVERLLADATPEAATGWADTVSQLAELLRFEEAVHHPLEDHITDRALHQGLTPTERRLVFRNLGQHQELLSRGEQLLARARAGAAGEDVDRDEFAADLQRYAALERRHMQFEEMHLFPLLASRLDNTDWNALQRTVDLQRQGTSDG